MTKVEPLTSIDLVVFRQYEYKGIKIVVEINRITKKISLVEHNKSLLGTFKSKEWLFVGRELEYMNTWTNILEATQAAIRSAKQELEKFKDDDISELIHFSMLIRDSLVGNHEH